MYIPERFDRRPHSRLCKWRQYPRKKICMFMYIHMGVPYCSDCYDRLARNSQSPISRKPIRGQVKISGN